MRVTKLIPATVGLGLLLAACAAPKVEPILPEPVYNKYGSVSEAACRPQSAQISSYYPERLQTCESFCGAGQVPDYAGIAAVTAVPRCVPLPQQHNGDRPDQGRDQRPTNG